MLGTLDGRAKPGHGDRGLCQARYKQPISLDRTAIGLTPPSTTRGAELAVSVDARLNAGHDD